MQKRPESGIFARRAYSKINEKNNSLKCSEDTIIRTEIHAYILSCINEGKTKTEIINGLSNKTRYQKYNKYFDTWIDDKMKKALNKSQNQMQR